MPTKLSRFCDGLMEAGWLLSVIVVPLFFDVYSSRVFEPDKLGLLRSLALVVGAAWLVKLIEQGGPRFERIGLAQSGEPAAPRSRLLSLLRLPLLAPVVAFGLVLLVSSAFSVTPRVSFFGSYQRLQGAYTTLAYLILFGSVFANLRSRAQLERLLTTVVLAGLPVSLYGLLQRFRLDPLPWGGDTVSRVSSSMGNPIFLGAYLIMVLPITLTRAVESFIAIARRAPGLPYEMIRSTVYVFIASVQLVALWFTGSRGPWLGFLAGSFFLFVLLTSYWRKRWLTVGTVGLAGALGVFLVVLNIPNGPLEPLRSTPGLGRLGHVFETDQETGLVRVLIWTGASQLVQPHEPLQFPDGHRDTFNALRPLIGYGPESMYVAFNRFYPAELGQVESRTASPDRSHNETWDALVTTGLAGLLVYLTLFASIFYYGLRWLGLMQTALQRRLFIALYAGGGLAGAAGLVLWRGLPFFGVGLPFGIMLGLIIYLAVLALFLHDAPPATAGQTVGRPEPWRALVLIGLIAAVMAHFTEIHFGIAVASSRTLFWLFAALLGVVGLNLFLPAEPDRSKKEEARRKKRPSRGATLQPSRASSSFLLPTSTFLVSAGIVAAVLCVLAYDFINNSYRLTSAPTILWQSFTTLPKAGGVTSLAVLLVLLITWLLGCLLTTAETAHRADSPPPLDAWIKGLGLALGISLGFALLYGLWLSGIHARLAGTPIQSEAELINAIGRLGSLLTSLYVFLALLMLALAWTLREAGPAAAMRTNGALAAVVLSVVALIAAYTTNLRVTQADITFKTAEGYAGSNNWEAATRLYLLASASAPNEDYYYLYVGKGFLQLADQLTEPDQRANIFNQARERLIEAQALNPLNTDHTANLGRLYRWWASVEPDPAERKSRAGQSEEYYARALSLSPHSALLWNEWALLDMTFLDDEEGALDKINHSLELDPKFDRTYSLLGDYHATLARRAGAAGGREEWEMAAEAYKQAVELEPESLNSRLALGAVYSATGDLDPAIEWYAGAIEFAPPEANLVNVYRALADLSLRAGRNADALQYAQSALATAPDELKPEIQAFIDNIPGS